MTIEPPFFTSPTALITSKISGAKSILHIQDYEIDAAFNLGILKGVFLKSVILKIEKLLMRQFDLISTISGAMVKKAISKGVQPEKTFFFPNWVDVASSLQPSQGCNIVRASTYIDYRERLQLPMESVVALYSGNMGAKQGLEILGQAAKRFADSDMPLPQLHFVFCGDGVGRNALMDLCSGLKNVRFIDLQPEEQLVNFLTMADIHLLPQRGGAADIVMPSKLGGILASGRPVLACAHIGTELANVSKIGGLVVPPNDLDAFCGALLNLVIDPELRCRLGQAGLQYAVDNLDKDLILGSFEAKLKELAQ
ncbi:hypothetical protein PHIN11_03040 [Polynucleobacter sp. HIN11]|nr:hypothetical protein PHIN11_03040 [Polynucleobacter sp. HIN11]